MVITDLGFLASALWTRVQCSPNLHRADGIFQFNCVTVTLYMNVFRDSLSLAVELIISFMPLPLIAKLKLARRKKIGVGLVFLVGSL